MNQQQENQLRIEAAKRGYRGEKLEAFVQFAKQKERQTAQPAQVAQTAEPEKKDGFFKSLAKGIAKPFVRVGTSAYNIAAAGVKAAQGDIPAANREATKTRNVMGIESKPLMLQPGQKGPAKFFPTAQSAGDVAGTAAELSSYVVGAGAAKNVIGAGAKGFFKQSVGQGAKQGAISGGLAGGGMAAQEEDATVGSIVGGTVKGAAMGGAAGAATGGIAAGAGSVKKGFSALKSKAVQTINPEATDALMRAIKPSAGKTNFKQSLENTLPVLKHAAQSRNKPINNLEDLAETIKFTKASVWDDFKQLLGANADDAVDTVSVADEIEKAITPRFARQNPAQADAIRRTAQTYRRTMSLQEIEDFLEEANNELHSYYAKNHVGQQAAKGDPAISHILKEAEGLRKLLYDRLNKLTGKDAAQIKKTYGALSEIQDEVLKRKNVAARQNPDSLAEQLGFAEGAGNVLKSAANMEFGDALKGAGQMATSRYMKLRNTTDFLIKKAFGQ